MSSSSTDLPLALDIKTTPLLEEKFYPYRLIENIPKNVLGLAQHNLQAGDILLFLPPQKGLNCAQKIICCAQALTRRRHGHYEVTHAAIFVGHEEKSGKLTPQIVDVTGLGYRKGDLKAHQPILIFRATNPEAGKHIAAEALRVQEDEIKPTWDCCTATGIFFKRKKLLADRKLSESKRKMNTKTVCSKFVIDVMKRALLDPSLHAFYPNIESRSFPKDLEADLHVNNNYQMFLSVGNNNLEGNPSQIIRTEIETQLVRLKAKITSSEAARDKFDAASRQYQASLTILEKSDWDDARKAVYLSIRMSDVFSINTGFGWRTTSKNALSSARYKAYLFNSIVDRHQRSSSFEADVTEAKLEAKNSSP